MCGMSYRQRRQDRYDMGSVLPIASRQKRILVMSFLSWWLRARGKDKPNFKKGEMSMSREMDMSREMSMSNHRGGHLYMQTNEVKNCIIHYHRSANGTLTEVERVATGGAGSGTFKPISGQESAPNAFEG